MLCAVDVDCIKHGWGATAKSCGAMLFLHDSEKQSKAAEHRLSWTIILTASQNIGAKKVLLKVTAAQTPAERSSSVTHIS